MRAVLIARVAEAAGGPARAAPLDERETAALFDAALAAVAAADTDHERGGAIVELAPVLGGAALDLVVTIDDGDPRADALAALAPHLGEHERERAVVLAVAIEDELWRANALARIAPHVGGDGHAAALEAARALSDPFGRARPLVALAATDNSVLLEALAALEAPAADARAGIDVLAPAVVANAPTAFGAALRALEGHGRRDLLHGLSVLAPALGDDDAAAEVADAILATGRWFP